MSRFYSLEDYKTGVFYKLEKSLFTNEKYKRLNSNAKVAYAILRDRNDLSVENKWVDEKGIYFYFDCCNLAGLMNVSTSTVNNIKKDLRKVGLLHEKRQGQGKPNKMYVLKPEVVDNALNSDFDISSIANLNKLEKRKSLGNDTELNETERKILNDNIFLSEDARIFLNTFEEYFGYKHRKVKDYPDIETYLDEEEARQCFYEYFNKYSTSNKKHDREKCSINNVFTSIDRYLLTGEW